MPSKRETKIFSWVGGWGWGGVERRICTGEAEVPIPVLEGACLFGGAGFLVPRQRLSYRESELVCPEKSLGGARVAQSSHNLTVW